MQGQRIKTKGFEKREEAALLMIRQRHTRNAPFFRVTAPACSMAAAMNKKIKNHKQHKQKEKEKNKAISGKGKAPGL